MTLQAPPWTEAAVRDTVAAIASQRAYDRSVAQSLWDRIWDAFLEFVRGLFEEASRHPEVRYVSLALVALVLLILTARLATSSASDTAVRRGKRSRTAVRADEDALADAERLAAAGEYTAAAHRLYAAIIANLSRRGEIRVHPSKTTGDYARELRRRKATAVGAFGGFRARYDRVIYGDLSCSAEDYGALRFETERLLSDGGDRNVHASGDGAHGDDSRHAPATGRTAA